MNDQQHEVAIVLPIYKSNISSNEEISLKSLNKYLSDYPIFTIGPFDTKNHFPNYNFMEFNPNNFDSVVSYSKLLLSKEFYKRFSKFKYILIYQLDCLVFSSNLKSWCQLGYDYIGAPIFINLNSPSLDYCFIGNGGLSLRKVSNFIRVFESSHIPKWSIVFNSLLPDINYLDFIKKYRVVKEGRLGVDWYTKNYSLNEDLFWSTRARLFYPSFNIAPSSVALKFSFEANPRFCYDANKKNLPFGAHGWEKWDKKIWMNFI